MWSLYMIYTYNNYVYRIFCMKCRDQFYVGETEQTLSGRISGHRATSSDMSKHFLSSGHTRLDMKMLVLSKTVGKRRLYRRGREYFYMQSLKPPLNADFNPP